MNSHAGNLPQLRIIMALKKYTSQYTQTPNKIIDHKKMSLKAKGLWTFLNSKPNDWDFSVRGTASFNKDGKDGITAGMKELEMFGYLKRVPIKGSSGQWDGHDYHLFDQPQITVSGKTVNGKTVDGKTGDGFNGSLYNTILNNNEVLNTKEENPVIEFEGLEKMSCFPNAVLNYLNDKKPSARGFEHTRSNLKDINARIKEKFTMDDFQVVIDFKVAKWKDDTKMKQYIRPSTLFGSKFNEYLIQAETAKTANDGSQNFKFNPTQKAELK